VFLERDGTLIEDVGYLNDPDKIRLEEGVVEGLAVLSARGHPLVILSNQSGIGRGMYTEGDARRVNERLAAMLREHGVEILAWYLCPHAPNDSCACRKPMPGMALAAARDCHLTLPGSYVIGDKRADVELADGIGGTGILLTTGRGSEFIEWAAALGRPVFGDMRLASEYIVNSRVDSVPA
jgi:histidinol-phosphate phosphatase family protein